jgi:hypothetical protein
VFSGLPEDAKRFPRNADVTKADDIRGATDFGPRGGKATARRLLAGADERARVPKR